MSARKLLYYSKEHLPTFTQLDELPTLDEIEKAITAHSNGKVPGKDNISSEVVKSSISLTWKPG